jgi:hypothetical protein
MNKILQVSQSTLSLWQTCPRKFQHQVLDNLHLSLAFNEKMAQGSKFHLLMQQREAGLDIASLAASDLQLQNWLRTFEQSPPMMIAGERDAEHQRTYKFNLAKFYPLLLLTAIYDLLILGSDQAQILDWKTHAQPISMAVLQASWQTRLYLYILAKTTDYLPEQISMSYWFANTGTTVAIAYNSEDHLQTEEELNQILTNMVSNIAGTEQSNFPQLPQGSEICSKCEFKYRCDRSSQTLNLSAVSTFPEVAI